MEQLVYMILRGLVIGVVVSAPMGPVGIFCIQRTLDKGRLSGFYTGVGAAISDLIYCLLTGFGLSFIEDFINNHRSPIQLLGSVVLIFFGIWLLRKKPDDSIAADADNAAPSREGDILKGFALTFSNPLILFLIIGLFAQFNFVIEGMKFYHYILGFIGIIGGALGWWWLVTHFVDKLRGHFNQRTMKLINTFIGIIILIFAAVGIFSSASTLLAAPVTPHATTGEMALTEFRVADSSMQGWMAEFPCDSGGCVRLEVGQEKQQDPFGDSPTEALRIKVIEMPAGRLLCDTVVADGVDPYKGKNSWRILCAGSRWNLFAGNREYRHVGDFMTRFIPSGGPSVSSLGKHPVEVSMFRFEPVSVENHDSTETDIFSALESLKVSPAETAGIYSMLDYEQDDAYARLGGSYRVAVLPSDDGYDVYYLGGARVNAGLWQSGRIKARLKATPFSTVYDVEWCDAEGKWMLEDVQAELDFLAKTMTVKFPFQGSSIRFRKE